MSNRSEKKIRWRMNPDGRMVPEHDTAGMTWPGSCTRCGHVHDAANVHVVARYQDCTVWKCPGCGASIDDRPIGWGGSFRRLDQ